MDKGWKTEGSDYAANMGEKCSKNRGNKWETWGKREKLNGSWPSINFFPDLYHQQTNKFSFLISSHFALRQDEDTQGKHYCFHIFEINLNILQITNILLVRIKYKLQIYTITVLRSKQFKHCKYLHGLFGFFSQRSHNRWWQSTASDILQT